MTVMDWTTGKMNISQGDPASQQWRMTIAADWGAKQIWGEENKLESLMIDHPEQVYGDLLPCIRHSDLRIVNVETVLGDRGAPLAAKGRDDKRFLIHADERTVNALKAVPFDIGCLANNHSLDLSAEGLAGTIETLRQAGIRTVGGGMSGADAEKPLIAEVKGTRVAIINCAEGEQCRSVDGGPGAYGLELHRLHHQIRELRQTGAAVIVIFHGGREHTPTPPPYVMHDLRAIAEMGPHAIIAHHPHVPQGIELHRGVPIVYSLGNFVFWQTDPAFYRHAGYVVHLDWSGSTITGLEITPYQVHKDGVRLMGANMRAKFAEDMTRVTALLADPAAIEETWNAFIDRMGVEQIARSLETGAQALRTRDLPAASRLLNLFFTPAHRELYIQAMKRVMNGTFGDSPAWAKELVDYWLDYSLAEAVSLDAKP
ncbi:CapA family protein [Paenibacillus hemerocallicola]|uniref:CapA family protein n=1 Tax=Paenibacillus hemerocallicola TaxID=1172614 RepID=A0A5C4SWR0_9BACL|nr:CapA family protein [Paenibacillus hemerocallicola]TNJ59874.1 CapA family protein [Paenibacillus hemerocallicola]